MTYKPGDAVVVEFVTSRFDTGAATNADSTPAGTLNQNGTDVATTVTVTNLDTGRYKAAFTIPDTYQVGDVLNLSIAATVNSVAGKGIVWTAILGEQLVQRYSKATAGGNNTVTLDSGASSVDNFYVGQVIEIYSGTGAGQSRVCTAYNGTTKVATVGRNWATNPASGSLCAILGLSVPKVNDSLQVDANLVAISGDAQSATDLKDFADTGYDPSTHQVQGVVTTDVASSVTTLGTNAITAASVSTGGGNAIADAFLKRDWTAVAGEASRSVLNALRALRNRLRVTSGVFEVYEEDDTTVAWSGPITSDATAAPITGMDPT